MELTRSREVPHTFIKLVSCLHAPSNRPRPLTARRSASGPTGAAGAAPGPAVGVLTAGE